MSPHNIIVCPHAIYIINVYVISLNYVHECGQIVRYVHLRNNALCPCFNACAYSTARIVGLLAVLRACITAICM